MDKQVLIQTHLKNLVDVAEFIDLDALDHLQLQGDMQSIDFDDQYMRGILINLGLLADHLGLVDPKKYGHRYSSKNIKNIFPKQIYTQNGQVCFMNIFTVKTMKLALSKIYMKTVDKQEILVEKEYSLTCVKLVQAFQILIKFIKTGIKPLFHVEKQSFLNQIGSYISKTPRNAQQKNIELNMPGKLDQLKTHLKGYERMMRVFEMTYLDLTENLKEQIITKNLQASPRFLEAEVEVNDQGQISIQNQNQMLDDKGLLIKKNCRIVRRDISKTKDHQSIVNLNSSRQTKISLNDGRSSHSRSNLKLSLSPSQRLGSFQTMNFDSRIQNADSNEFDNQKKPQFKMNIFNVARNSKTGESSTETPGTSANNSLILLKNQASSNKENCSKPPIMCQKTSNFRKMSQTKIQKRQLNNKQKNANDVMQEYKLFNGKSDYCSNSTRVGGGSIPNILSPVNNSGLKQHGVFNSNMLQSIDSSQNYESVNNNPKKPFQQRNMNPTAMSARTKQNLKIY